MTAVKKLDHLGIVVADLDAARAFYEKALGITCTHVEDLPERGLRVAFLPVGDTRIELITPLHPQSEVSKFLETRGAGLHHICFETSDVNAASADLKAQSVKLTQDAPRPGAHHTMVTFVHPKSSGGVLVELAEHQK